MALSAAGVASRRGPVASMDQRDGEEATKNSAAWELYHFLHTNRTAKYLAQICPHELVVWKIVTIVTSISHDLLPSFFFREARGRHSDK